MGRFLAGVASALLLCGAGLFWFTSKEPESPLAQAIAPQAKATSPVEDAPPPQATERTREEKRFDRYDKDKTQTITAEEYLASRRKAYAKLDMNRDGRLSFEEWAKKTTDKFVKADSDRSRTLSRAEFATTKLVRKTRPDCPRPRAADDEG